MEIAPTIIVTGAGGPLGVNLVRSLRESELRFRIVGTEANRWHLPLSLCDQTYRIPFARDREGYQKAMTELAAAENATAILPTHPVEVRAVAELSAQDALGGLRTALPAAHVLRIADDKGATQEKLLAAGVPVPATVALEDEEALSAAFERFDDGAPVWVRGSGAPGLGIGGAALPCSDIRVARAWIEHHRGWGKMVASEYLPGANLTWMAAFRDGELVVAGARERLEYVLPHVSPSGITGAPAVSRTVSRRDVSAIGERAVRTLDDEPHGVYFVDLKEDKSGEPRVTEINAGRCGTTVHFYTRAGVNFPELLARLALRRELPAFPDPHGAIPPGRYWVRTLDCGPVFLEEDADFDRYPSIGVGQ